MRTRITPNMDTFLGNEIGGEKNKSRERGMKKDI